MRTLALMVHAAVLVCTCAILWTGLLLPPPHWLLKYGLDPSCEVTGRRLVGGLEFVEIGPGAFRMGSPWLFGDEERGANLLGRITSSLGLASGGPLTPSNEMPVHWVEFPNGFAIASCEVTNDQYELFDPEHERSVASPGDRHPVVDVTWEDASAYCEWLSLRSGRPVRLPSEAEWECVGRCGKRTERPSGSCMSGLNAEAWNASNSARAQPICTASPNQWGFFDLLGNVSEWCEDTLQSEYVGAPVDGRAWHVGDPREPQVRVFRGGNFNSSSALCHPAFRFGQYQDTFDSSLGFRPAYDLPRR